MKSQEHTTDIPAGPERSEGIATTEFWSEFSPPDAPKMALKLQITEIPDALSDCPKMAYHMKSKLHTPDIPAGPERSEGIATTEFLSEFSPPDAL